MAHDNLVQHLAAAQKLPTIKNGNVELGFFSKRKNSFIDAMADGATASFKLDEDGLIYEFEQPVFIDTITVESADDEGIRIKYEVQTLSATGY